MTELRRTRSAPLYPSSQPINILPASSLSDEEDNSHQDPDTTFYHNPWDEEYAARQKEISGRMQEWRKKVIEMDEAQREKREAQQKARAEFAGRKSQLSKFEDFQVAVTGQKKSVAFLV